MNAFQRAFTNAVRHKIHDEGRPAVLGNNAGAIYFVDEAGNTVSNTVWIRYVEADGVYLSEAAVRNSSLPAVVGLPVLIVTRHGVLTAIIDEYGPRMQQFVNYSGWIPQSQHWQTHELGGTDPGYLDGLQFKPGLVKPSSPAAMTVYVNPFWYVYEGVEDVFEGGTSGSLSSYVPGTDNGTGHFVIICLDRANNAIAIVDGDDYGGFWGGSLTLAAIAAVSIPADHYPLAVVEFYYGQTAVKAADITFDRRRWGLETGLDINGLTEDTDPDPAADFIPTYDSSAGTNKKVKPENFFPGRQSILFSQTEDTTLANTVTPTDLINSTNALGSVTLPAGLLAAGSVVRITMTGHYSTTGTPTFELAVNLGGTELATTGVKSLATGAANIGWKLDFEIICRSTGATGTVVASGIARMTVDGTFGLVKTTAVTVDTTGTLAITAPGTWGTADAANTLTCQTVVIEHHNVIGL